MLLNELVEISNRYGKNEDYVLAGGGNTSFKDDLYLYIKGSGTSLATITADGFVKLTRKKLFAIWDKTYSAQMKEREAQVLADLMDAREMGEEHKRPSVETLLHNLLPHAYVVHLHPAMVNGLTCAKKGKEFAKALFGESFIWIDNIEPGYNLAKKVRDELTTYQLKYKEDCQIIFLQNHGVFVSADKTEEIDVIYKNIIEKISHVLVELPDFSDVEIELDEVNRATDLINQANIFWTEFVNNKSLNQILKAQKEIVFSTACTPDHIVYCKAYPLVVKDVKELMIKIKSYQDQYGYPPRIIILPDLGVFICGNNEASVKTTKRVYLDSIKIDVYAKTFGGLSLMPQNLVDFIVNWEAESYRSSVSN